MHRRTRVLLGLMAPMGAVVFAAGAPGCQGNTETIDPGTGGGSTVAPTTSSAGSTSGSSSASSSTGGGGGGTGGAAQVVTIQQITTGAIGLKIPVALHGVVAMSHKFLASQSKSTGSCLWGIFLSAPGLGETGPNTGILALSYGTPAMIPAGGTKAYCPILGMAPAGDAIPDDTQPGDVLDLVGKTDRFKQKTCGTNPGETSVPQYQLSNVIQAAKTGTAPLPAPHLLTDAEVAQLASPTDSAFHDQWGGVKVRIQNVTSTPQDNGNGGTGITDAYGHIVLAGSNLYVGDKLYYQGLLAKSDACHKGPTYANAATTFTQIEGFSFLDYCTWSLEPGNRCTELAPASDDCAAVTCP